MVDQETLRKAIAELLPIAQQAFDGMLEEHGMHRVLGPFKVALYRILADGETSTVTLSIPGSKPREIPYAQFQVGRETLDTAHSKGVVNNLDRQLRAAGESLAVHVLEQTTSLNALSIRNEFYTRANELFHRPVGHLSPQNIIDCVHDFYDACGIDVEGKKKP